jgi:hypothetical protein
MTQRFNTSSIENKQDTRSEARNSRRNFWATTGCATIVAAAIGAGATLLAQQAKQSPPTPPASSTMQADNANTTSPEATAAVDTGIHWQGTFVLGNYADFDLAPPRNESGDLNQDVEGNLSVYDDGSVWTAATPPTKQQCFDQIATRAASSIPLEVGTEVCYQTEAGRIVYFKVNSIVQQGDGLLASPRFEINVVVWKR